MSKVAIQGNASGTGTFTIQSPATNTDRVLTLPDEAGTVVTTNSLNNVLEEISFIPRGQTISTRSGSITAQTVNASQTLASTYSDITGSVISYQPPSNAIRVEYSYTFKVDREPNDAVLTHFKLLIDNTDVTYARFTLGSGTYYGELVTFKWIIECAHTSNDSDLGWFTSWSSAKEIKLMAREYSSTYDTLLNISQYWDGAQTNTELCLPVVTIKAFSS